MSDGWKLEGYDTFEGEYYPLGKYNDGYEPSYSSREAALKDAQRRLAELDVSQPSAGGQGRFGIQDRVFIIHPDGTRERV